MTTSKHKSKAYRDGYQAYLATNGCPERVDTQYRNSKPLEAEFWRGWHDCKKPFLCSCMVKELSNKTTDRMMKIVENHFDKGEKMTKEEIFKKHEKGRVLTYDKVPEFILNAMEEYALHIAEQAVEELEIEYPYKKAGDRDSYLQYREGIDTGLGLVLDRIETLIGQE